MVSTDASGISRIRRPLGRRSSVTPSTAVTLLTPAGGSAEMAGAKPSANDSTRKARSRIMGWPCLDTDIWEDNGCRCKFCILSDDRKAQQVQGSHARKDGEERVAGLPGDERGDQRCRRLGIGQAELDDARADEYVGNDQRSEDRCRHETQPLLDDAR